MLERDSNEKPSVADSVYIAYDGLLTHGYVFDNRKFPIWLDLANSLEGFREGVSELKQETLLKTQWNNIL